jgi:lipid-binding SYLF domain-containing protein
MPANTANKTKTQSTIEERAAATLKRLEEKDPGLKQMLKKAYAYAVFPSVGKASLVVGGSYGHGAVYERGKFIGHATISQFTAGVQIGGDTFTEVLVFQNQGALERLKHGRMAFAANASAVLVKAGAAAAKGFSNGVAAYTYASGGMLLEIAIGGQKFKFKPAGEEDEQQSKSGGRNGAGAKGKAAASSEQDEGEAEGDEAQDDEESGGLLGRAMGGVRSALGGAAEGVKSAASRVTETAKAHPVAATVVATTVAAGAALLIVRAVRGTGSSSGQGEEGEDAGYEDEGNEDENQQASSQAEDEGGEEEGQDQGEEAGQEDEQDDRNDTLNQLRNRRRRSRAQLGGCSCS